MFTVAATMPLTDKITQVQKLSWRRFQEEDSSWLVCVIFLADILDVIMIHKSYFKQKYNYVKKNFIYHIAKQYISL